MCGHRAVVVAFAFGCGCAHAAEDVVRHLHRARVVLAEPALRTDADGRADAARQRARQLRAPPPQVHGALVLRDLEVADAGVEELSQEDLRADAAQAVGLEADRDEARAAVGAVESARGRAVAPVAREAVLAALASTPPTQRGRSGASTGRPTSEPPPSRTSGTAGTRR